ncbi:hypothetical protein [Buchananella hordeovulneris]|uniref:hypothetical protein n=1 Tax=Buchananella hordeovulneris TaxID=52770 RepID=UPI0026DCDD74|nr:hypothetical protein [Buchananella hordeovulneris]MDO5080902.1 hypothetical protein [Buchananella hordeovulneris]
MTQPVVTDEDVFALKVAAIDAYMHDEGYERKGDTYEKFSENGEGCRYEVLAPRSSGEGGGKMHIRYLPGTGKDGQIEYAGDLYVGPFDAIRGAIDELLKPWMWLPEEGNIDAVIAQFKGIMDGLSDGETSQSQLGDGPEIDEDVKVEFDFPDVIPVTSQKPFWSDLTAIEGVSSEWLGLAAGVFYTKFIKKGKSTAKNICAIFGACGCVVAAEKGAAKALRKALPEIVKDVTQSFAARSSASISLEPILKVVKLAKAAFDLFVKVNTGNLIALGDSAVDAQDFFGDPAKGEIASAGTYEETMSYFSSLLTDLNLKMRQVEEGCVKYLNSIVAHIQGNSGDFDISVEGYTLEQIDSVKQTARVVDRGELVTNRTEMYRVGKYHMPAVAEAFQGLYRDASGLDVHKAFARNAAIGIGQHGPAPEFWNAMNIILACAKEFGDEMENGGTLLLAVSREFWRAEEDNEEWYAGLSVSLEEALGNFKEV